MQKKSDTEMIVSMPAHMSIEIALAEHVAVIRALGKRVIGDVIEMGRRLTDAKKIAGYGGWLPWLDREFGWSDDTARAGKSESLLFAIPTNEAPSGS